MARLLICLIIFQRAFCENVDEDAPHFSPQVYRDLRLHSSPNPFLDPGVQVTFPRITKVDLGKRLGLPWYSSDADLPRWVYQSVPRDEWPESFRKIFSTFPPGFTWNGMGK